MVCACRDGGGTLLAFVIPWGDSGFSFPNLHTCADTHTCTDIHLHTKLGTSEWILLFHVLILSFTAPFWRRNDLFWQEMLGRVWVQLDYLQQEGMAIELIYWGRGMHLGDSTFLSWMLSIYKPHTAEPYTSRSFCSPAAIPHNKVNLLFALSSLQIGCVTLHQGLSYKALNVSPTQLHW